MRRLVGLTIPAAAYRELVYLSVMGTPRFLPVETVERLCHRIAGDTPRIYAMRFLEMVAYPCVLRDIAIGLFHIRIERFEAIVHCPTHNPHERRIT